MSKLFCVTVRDEKADCFAHPFFVPALGLALRMFEDWSKDKETAVGRHPEDYSIFKIGEFDQVAGVFTPDVIPVFLGRPSVLGGVDLPVNSSSAQKHFSEVHGKAP